MILTRDVIRREIEAGRVVIDPFLADQVGPASIDLHLGDEIRVMHEGREIPVSREALLGAPHCALVINDMQNDFLSPRGACARRRCGYDRARASAIVPPIEQVVRTARARGALVIFLQSTIAADDLAPSRTWPPSDAVREGTWGWRTIDSLKPQRGDIVIPKYRPDGFHGTRLDDVLRRRGIKTLVLAGVNADYGGLQTLMRLSLIHI